jgi:hypothetical protein
MRCCPEGSTPTIEGFWADEKLHSLTHGVRTPELAAPMEGSLSALRPVSVTVLGEIGLANARAWNLGWMASLLSLGGLSRSPNRTSEWTAPRGSANTAKRSMPSGWAAPLAT